MIDFRDYKDDIRAAVRKESENDKNWYWRVKTINKGKVEIVWQYANELLECPFPFTMTYFEDYYDDGELCDAGLKMVEPGGHIEFVFIGDDIIADVNTVEKGIAAVIHTIAVYAHNHW